MKATYRGSQKQSFRLRLWAWLAVLSMLLIVVAPVISQSSAAAPRHHGMHEAGHEDHHGGHGSDSGPLHDACGYCTLAAHSPLMPVASMALPARLQAGQTPAPTRRANPVRTTASYSLNQARAPPIALLAF